MMVFRFLCFCFFGLLSAKPISANELKIALVLDKGGKDDKSFNAAAFAGSERARKELGIQVKLVESMDDAGIEATMRSFAQRDFDLIIGVGFAMADAVKKVSEKFPKVNFALVDAEVNHPNVRNLLFEEHEGSFLVGAMAALHSKSGKVGFLGGMDVPLIRRFQMGFEAGARRVNPKIEVVTNYIGVTSAAWNNPPKAKEIALAQINRGVDVIFGAAGASNYGVFDAVAEKKKLAIGVDSNQNWVKPGSILTSMLKRVDVAVYQSIRSIKEKTFKGGTERFGLRNQGIDYAMDEHNKAVVDPKALMKVEELKAAILSGKIAVPDYYKKKP